MRRASGSPPPPPPAARGAPPAGRAARAPPPPRPRQRWPERPVEITPVPGELGTPYDRAAPDHTRYVSFAAWLCPTHCVEPAICPAIGAQRTWEMGEAIGALTARLRAGGRPVFGPALFVCRHHVFGVGAFAVAAVLEGDRIVAGAA